MHLIAKRDLEGSLSIFTITTKTTDFGPKYVVRERRIRNGSIFVAIEPLAVEETLDDARAALLRVHPGLANVGRAQEDDPVIVESWL